MCVNVSIIVSMCGSVCRSVSVSVSVAVFVPLSVFVSICCNGLVAGLFRKVEVILFASGVCMCVCGKEEGGVLFIFKLP